MGITISHKIGIADKNKVKNILDNTQKLAGYLKKDAEARGISFDIDRKNERQLFINIGHCETLGFNFMSVKEILEDKKKGKEIYGYDYSYQLAVLTDDGKKELYAGYETEQYPQNEMFYSADFCKTQFCKDLHEHKYVAELIRSVASRANYAEISDEADYYYSLDTLELGKNIHELGQMINGLATQLKAQGWKDENIIKGN